MTSLIGSLIGAFGNTTAARTSTSSSTYTPTFTPAQSSLQDSVGSALESRLQNGVDLTPELTAGTDQINKSYQGASDTLTQQLAARGFGKSGAVGSGLQSIALAKAGAEGSLQNQLDVEQQKEQDTTLSDAEQFGFASPGNTQTGTKVGAGSSLAGGLAGGFAGYLSGLSGLNSLGGGSGGDSGLGDDVPGLGSSIWKNGTSSPASGGTLV